MFILFWSSFDLTAHRLLSNSSLGLPYRILNMNHKKELLRSLWVELAQESDIALICCLPGTGCSVSSSKPQALNPKQGLGLRVSGLAQFSVSSRGTFGRSPASLTRLWLPGSGRMGQGLQRLRWCNALRCRGLWQVTVN